MRTPNLIRGTSLATAVAALLLAAGCGSDDGGETGTTEAQIRCLGGNECAAMSECAGGPAGGECAGLNECAGQGWVYTETAADCEQKGGTPQQA